jgi:hypothetical protein
MKKTTLIALSLLLLTTACSKDTQEYQTNTLYNSETGQVEEKISDYNDGKLYFSFKYNPEETYLEEEVEEQSPGEKLSEKTLVYYNNDTPAFKINIYTNEQWEETVNELHFPPESFYNTNNYQFTIEELKGGLKIIDAVIGSFQAEELDQ